MGNKNRNITKQVRMVQSHYNRLHALAISRFTWEGLPPQIDTRFLEEALYEYGTVAFAIDDVTDTPIALPYTMEGNFDVYGNPVNIRMYSPKVAYNYHPKQFVVCFDNLERVTYKDTLHRYAARVSDMQVAADVNIGAQKTPVLLTGDEKQVTTLRALYEQYDGNAPAIMKDPSLSPDAISAIKTEAPFNAHLITEVATTVWNEALTMLGIPNMGYMSSGRKVTDEVLRSQGGSIAARFSPERARNNAAEMLKEIFGWDVKVTFRADFDQVYMHMPVAGGGGIHHPDMINTATQEGGSL